MWNLRLGGRLGLVLQAVEVLEADDCEDPRELAIECCYNLSRQINKFLAP